MSLSAAVVQTGGRSATELLADRANRIVIVALAEAAEPLRATQIAERWTTDASPRQLRDRVRALERMGILEAAEGGGPPRITIGPRWTLSAAGRDLYHLLSLMTRIAESAAALRDDTPPAIRERIVGLVLKAMADPVVVQINRCLATGPHDPVALEEGCRPIARRTMYRRLEMLVGYGVVTRRTTRRIPRRTIYELADRWRPVVTVLLLSAWWGWRHDSPGDPVHTNDLVGLLRGILPNVRLRDARDHARLRWAVEVDGDERPVTLEVRGDRLTLVCPQPGPNDPHPVEVSVGGPPDAWATALVTNDREGLDIRGDAELSRECGDAVRAALLAYLR